MAKLTPEKVWARIEHVLKARRPLEAEWRENIRILTESNPGRELGLSTMDSAINLFQSNVRTMLPSLYFQGPDLRVLPDNPLGIESAPLVKAILDYRFRKARAKRHIKKQINSAFCCSWGWLKAGYVKEETRVAMTVDPETGEEVPQEEVVGSNPMAELTGYTLLEQGSHSTVRHVSSFDVLFDSNALGPQDEGLEWIAHRVLLHIDDCKGSPYYKQGALRLLTPTIDRGGRSSTSGETEFFNFDIDESAFWGTDLGPKRSDGAGKLTSPDDAGKFYAWEFWNMRHRELYVIPEQQTNVFIRDGKLPYPTHPFHGLLLTVEAPETPYPPPILSMLKNANELLNQLREHEIAHVKKSVPKYVVDTTLLDKEDQNELMQGGAAPVCRIKGAVDKAFTVVQGAPMNSEHHVLEDKIRDDAAMASGIADYRRGVPVGKQMTATEQNALQDAASIVVEENRDRIADCIADVAQFMLQLEKKYTTKEQIVRIVGSSDIDWRKWTNEDIQGEHDITVIAGSQTMQNRAVAQKIALDYFNLFSPIALQGGPVNFYHLAHNVLETGNFKNIDMVLPRNKMERPPQDPYAENELLRSGGMPEASINDNDGQHVQVHMSLLQQPGLDPRIAYSVGQHVRNHDIQRQQKQQMQAQAAMGGPQQAGPGGPQQGPPGPPGQGGPQTPMGSVNGPGAGRQTPSPGQPANPRQFSESPGGQGIQDILRVLGR